MTISTILTLEAIKAALQKVDPFPLIEAGFVVYSRGQVVVPPVGEMLFPEVGGDCHIKYGYIQGDDVFVVKIANYFPHNARTGQPADDGMVMIYDQKSGSLRAVLIDRCYLTHVRTAVAGAVVARHLAPKNITRIGIIGTGTQARLQLKYLKTITSCREVSVYGRDPERVAAYIHDMAADGFHVARSRTVAELADCCNLIVTTTAAHTPLLMPQDIRPGIHITAMGSDSADKQELHADVLGRADLVVVDSIEHASRIGELHHAKDVVRRERLRELGAIIADPKLGRTSEDQCTVADLVGIAVQDIQIAKAVESSARTSAPSPMDPTMKPREAR